MPIFLSLVIMPFASWVVYTFKLQLVVLGLYIFGVFFAIHEMLSGFLPCATPPPNASAGKNLGSSSTNYPMFCILGSVAEIHAGCLLCFLPHEPV